MVTTELAQVPSAGPGGDDQVPLADPTQRAVSLVVAGVVCILCVPYMPGFSYWEITLRMAIIAPLAAWGAVCLLRLIRRGDGAARWAGALVVWMLISALLSPEPLLATWLGFGNDRSWIVRASFLALWAVGRRGGSGARPYLEIALVVGLMLDAGLILLQTLSDGSGLLRLSGGRASGFDASPVYAGALMSGGIVLVAAKARSAQRWWFWLPAIVAFTVAADLTGSRIAILAAIPLALFAVVRGGWLRIGAVLGALLVGLALSAAILSSTDTVSSTSRLATENGGGGVATRTTMWKLGAEAALERPIQGWGTGRFRTATSPRITAEFAADEGPDKIFFDAHNVFVEQLVTGGVVGLVLTVGFGWSVARRVKGPLAWFGLAIAASWLLQPLSIVTVPVALLALGAASIDDRGPPRSSRVGVQRAVVMVTTGVVLVGLAAGLVVALTARQVRVAETEYSVEAIDSARRFFPRDPTLSDTRTQVLQARAGEEDTDEARARALESARRTVELEPSRPTWWIRLALVEYGFGPGSEAERVAAAQAALDRALEQNPWSLMALTTHHLLALEAGDAEEAARWEERLCAIDACPAPPPEDTEGQP